MLLAGGLKLLVRSPPVRVVRAASEGPPGLRVGKTAPQRKNFQLNSEAASERRGTAVHHCRGLVGLSPMTSSFRDQGQMIQEFMPFSSLQPHDCGRGREGIGFGTNGFAESSRLTLSFCLVKRQPPGSAPRCATAVTQSRVQPTASQSGTSETVCLRRYWLVGEISEGQRVGESPRQVKQSRQIFDLQDALKRGPEMHAAQVHHPVLQSATCYRIFFIPTNRPCFGSPSC
jgi:hypothetical protein